MIQELLSDTKTTEIIFNDWDEIYIEQNGVLYKRENIFANKNYYLQFINNIAMDLNEDISLKNPFVQGLWQNFRVQIIASHISHAAVQMNLRRIAEQQWTLAKLEELGSISNEQANYISELIHTKKNLLIIGSTGSGKTSFLNAILNACNKTDRCVILEDTSEIRLPNSASTKLITQDKESENLKTVSLEDLLKISLRLRPDRIVVGEVRGREAKNLVLALSTGHNGSMGTLHAKNAKEALARLELLIQMGAPEWNTYSIQKLIYYAFDEVLCITKDEAGNRKLSEICRITGLETNGLLLEPVVLDFFAK